MYIQVNGSSCYIQAMCKRYCQVPLKHLFVWADSYLELVVLPSLSTLGLIVYEETTVQFI